MPSNHSTADPTALLALYGQALIDYRAAACCADEADKKQVYQGLSVQVNRLATSLAERANQARQEVPRGATDGKASTPRQIQVLRFVEGACAHSLPPTLQEVAAFMGARSRFAATCALRALIRLGYLERVPHVARGLRVLKSPPGVANNLLADLKAEGFAQSTPKPDQIEETIAAWDQFHAEHASARDKVKDIEEELGR